MIQYIFYMALQNQRDKVLTRRLLWQQRHLHYMHSRGSDDCGGPSMACRPADEVLRYSKHKCNIAVWISALKLRNLPLNFKTISRLFHAMLEG